MLDAALTAQLRDHFAKLAQPIELVASLDDSPTSAQLEQLLGELAALSPSVTYRRADDAERRPSFAVTSALAGSTAEGRVRFAGLPLGHEFTSLVLAMLQAGGHPFTAPGELLARVSRLEGPFHFETFFSQSCQNCPEVVQALNLMSVLNPAVRHVAIDGAAFAAEAEARSVMAVPTVFVNGEAFGQGRMTLEEIVTRLDEGGDGPPKAEVAAAEPFDVLVVGGGPAGASAAIYAARKGIRTGIVAERFGGQVLDTLAIENFISVPSTEGPKLAGALEEHVKGYAVEVLAGERASGLGEAGDDGLLTVHLERGVDLRARTVVLASGARWRQLNVPGEAEYRNRGVTYCPHCDGPLFAGKRVAVVGGGNSGVEAAIDLAGVVTSVTLLEFDDHLRADAVLQRKLASLPNAEVICNARTTTVVGGTAVTGLVYEDRVSGEVRQLALDGVFVQIGLLPNTEWLDGAVAVSASGEVAIDERGATSVPGVFAAGDCTTVPFKQIVIAMGAGSTAALSAFDYLIRTTAPAEAAVV